MTRGSGSVPYSTLDKLAFGDRLGYGLENKAAHFLGSLSLARSYDTTARGACTIRE